MAWVRLNLSQDSLTSQGLPTSWLPQNLTSKRPDILRVLFIPQIFLLTFLTRPLLFPATPTSSHTTIFNLYNNPRSFRSFSHSKLDCQHRNKYIHFYDCQPQSLYCFVWVFCLFVDGGEYFVCGRFGSWLGCVVLRRQLLRVAFQSRIELGFRCTLHNHL